MSPVQHSSITLCGTVLAADTLFIAQSDTSAPTATAICSTAASSSHPTSHGRCVQWIWCNRYGFIHSTPCKTLSNHPLFVVKSFLCLRGDKGEDSEDMGDVLLSVTQTTDPGQDSVSLQLPYPYPFRLSNQYFSGVGSTYLSSCTAAKSLISVVVSGNSWNTIKKASAK